MDEELENRYMEVELVNLLKNCYKILLISSNCSKKIESKILQTQLLRLKKNFNLRGLTLILSHKIISLKGFRTIPLQQLEGGRRKAVEHRR